MSDILTPRELADYLRVSEATIRQMAARGEIPHAFRIGKQWRIPYAAVAKLTGWRAPHPTTSESTNAHQAQAATLYDGQSVESSANRADSQTALTPNKPRLKNAGSFATRFPDHAHLAR